MGQKWAIHIFLLAGSMVFCFIIVIFGILFYQENITDFFQYESSFQRASEEFKKQSENTPDSGNLFCLYHFFVRQYYSLWFDLNYYFFLCEFSTVDESKRILGNASSTTASITLAIDSMEKVVRNYYCFLPYILAIKSLCNLNGNPRAKAEILLGALRASKFLGETLSDSLFYMRANISIIFPEIEALILKNRSDRQILDSLKMELASVFESYMKRLAGRSEIYRLNDSEQIRFEYLINLISGDENRKIELTKKIKRVLFLNKILAIKYGENIRGFAVHGSFVSEVKRNRKILDELEKPMNKAILDDEVEFKISSQAIEVFQGRKHRITN